MLPDKPVNPVADDDGEGLEVLQEDGSVVTVGKDEAPEKAPAP